MDGTQKFVVLSSGLFFPALPTVVPQQTVATGMVGVNMYQAGVNNQYTLAHHMCFVHDQTQRLPEFEQLNASTKTDALRYAISYKSCALAFGYSYGVRTKEIADTTYGHGTFAQVQAVLERSLFGTSIVKTKDVVNIVAKAITDAMFYEPIAVFNLETDDIALLEIMYGVHNRRSNPALSYTAWSNERAYIEYMDRIIRLKSVDPDSNNG